MFKELRKKLVTSNMLLVFGIITISFVALFFFMQRILYNESILKMRTMIYKDQIIFEKPEADDQAIPITQDDSVYLGSEEDEEVFDDNDTGYAIITYSAAGNIIVQDNKRYEIKSEELKKQFEDLVTGKKTGTTIYRGGKYRYLINKNSFPSGTYKIVLYNLSSESSFLKWLLLGLILGDILLSVISYMISLYIATESITPIIQAYDKQKKFTEDASHELRTPLTVMKTNMEVLKSDKKATIEDVDKWIGYIDDEVSRMTELVNDLLSLSRLDNESKKEEIEDLNLTEELYKTCEVYKKYIEGKGLTLKSDIDKNVTFTCHPGRIKQLINILLDNAIKYNKENGEVKIILKKNDYTFNLIIKDTGVGIKKEEIPNVFDRFFRADSSRSTQGTGLGLAIAYGIVKSHFGTIKVNSEVGKGTEFIITFPYDINNK